MQVQQQVNDVPSRTLIGPITQDDWRNMVNIREDVRYMKKINNNGKYDEGIAKEENIFKEIMKSYV